MGPSVGSPEATLRYSMNQGVLVTPHSGEHGNPSDPHSQGNSLMGRAVTLPTPDLTNEKRCKEEATESPWVLPE